MTLFGKLNPDGSVSNARTINQSSLRACPHFILDPSHYRDDESCRCNDPDATVMFDWGYTWDDDLGRWA